jgi:hypothetical protein
LDQGPVTLLADCKVPFVIQRTIAIPSETLMLKKRFLMAADVHQQ